MRRVSPAWFLFFFAPLTAEYVSGSSPYLNPFVLLANLVLYGVGTNLIRELRVRWKKGWLTVFILAAAYMVAEEGLMLNTLFDPTKNATGRWLGVNWVWTAGMLVVHSLVSVFAPILLAEAMFNERSRESWIKPHHFWWLLAAFAVNVFGLGSLIAPTNRPGVASYLIEALFISGCLWLASRTPTPRKVDGLGNSKHSLLGLFVGSLVGFSVTMIVNFAAPTLGIPAVAEIGGYNGGLDLIRARNPERQTKTPGRVEQAAPRTRRRVQESSGEKRQWHSAPIRTCLVTRGVSLLRGPGWPTAKA